MKKKGNRLGMSGRGGKKRHSSQPLEGAAKDSRAEAEMEEASLLQTDENVDDSATWSQVAGRGRAGGRGVGSFATSNRFGLLSQAASYPDRSMRSASVTSRGSRRGGLTNPPQPLVETQNAQNKDLTYSESSLGAQSRFRTPEPDGPHRDDFAIEFQQLNGKPFKGTITLKEARDKVFRDILGFNPRILHSIRPVFGGTPTIRFKLKEQVNLDDLATVEYFDLERVVGPQRTDVISCRIMGIRGLQAAPNYDGTSNDIRWIKVENCEYSIEDDLIVEWLKIYGEPLSLLGEDVLPDSDSDSGPLGNGTYSIKMKLHKDIPQFLPMHGRKIRIYFKNMNKLCSNCYGCHSRRQCTNERTPWIVYVRDFMQRNPEITENYYGKWWDIVDQEFPGYFDQDQARDLEETSSAPNVPRKEAPSKSTATAAASAPSVRPTSFAPTQTPYQSQEPPRRSRDPRVRRQQDEEDELDLLIQKGLTFGEAKGYLKNKKEQEQLEQRMNELLTNQRSERGVSRVIVTKTGPGASRGGRGGLNFN